MKARLRAELPHLSQNRLEWATHPPANNAGRVGATKSVGFIEDRMGQPPLEVAPNAPQLTPAVYEVITKR
jgi:hypothetical protein